MNGGTTFHFVADGIQSALEQAKAAANGQDVRLGGGVATMGRASMSHRSFI
jgi:dihydrofolate reductase